MRIGLIVNPVAGMGGPVGLKGTDDQIFLAAMLLGAEKGSSHAIARRALSSMRRDIEFVSVEDMGSDVLDELKIEHERIPLKAGSLPNTDRDDTMSSAKIMEKDCDLILFCGGDGTARDIYEAVGERVPVLGIPAGVKMYSSVFATTPEDVPAIVDRFMNGDAKLMGREVMDNDENASADSISPKLYGYLNVPYVPVILQSHKGLYEGNDEKEEADEVAEYIVSLMDSDTLYIIGPGGTAGRIMERMGLEPTVLGIDAVFDGKVAGKDMNEKELIDITERYEKKMLILGIIGNQGFFLGRGNKELTPAVIRNIGIDNIILVSGITKLNDLGELHVDTGDPELDKGLKGFRKVVFRYARERMMRVI